MPDNSNYQFRAVPINLIDYVKKKTKSSEYYFRYLLDRTMMMFEYKNLPDTIEPNVLERYLQVNGVACITEAKGKLYCFGGSWGGKQDVYYRPTKFIIANPHISQLTEDKTFTKEVTIFGDEPHTGVLMRNDTEWASLTPLIARYAVLMCENCVTIRVADIMLRILALLTAGTDKEKKSAEAYLSKLEAGELGIIGSNSFKQSINMQSPPSNNGSYLTQFIELQQYLKGSFFNELGLRANYNMKREAIGAGESTLDADAILPLCDNMLKCRREDISQLNDLYGLDITVDFSSAWLENRLEASANIISQLTEAGVIDSVSPLPDGGNGGGMENMEHDGADGSSGEGSNGNETRIERDKESVSNENRDAERENGKAGEADGVPGKMSERHGAETADAGKPDERGDSEEGRRAEEAGGEETGGEENDSEEKERANEVRGELEDNSMTLVEGLVEVMEDKVSQLIAKARADVDNDGVEEGGAEDDVRGEEVSETEGLPADN